MSRIEKIKCDGCGKVREPANMEGGPNRKDQLGWVTCGTISVLGMDGKWRELGHGDFCSIDCFKQNLNMDMFKERPHRRGV